MKTRVQLKVRPGATETAFTGRFGDAWKLNVAAPPVDGRANEAIVRFLARITGVPSSSVRIVTGASASMKLIEVDGIDGQTLERVILESHGPRPNSGRTSP
jgi:uncharacterized protein YggU (UPF0235/DUF167 family)